MDHIAPMPINRAGQTVPLPQGGKKSRCQEAVALLILAELGFPGINITHTGMNVLSQSMAHPCHPLLLKQNK